VLTVPLHLNGIKYVSVWLGRLRIWGFGIVGAHCCCATVLAALLHLDAKWYGGYLQHM